MIRLQVLGTFLFFFVLTAISAQKFEIQLFTGPCSGFANVRKPTYPDLQAVVYNDSSILRSGFAVKLKFKNRFRLRTGLDLYRYRTEYYTPGFPNPAGGGNLYNEKITLSLLPEYQFSQHQFKHVGLEWYGFAGLDVGLEIGKNWSYNYVFDQINYSYTDERKPDPSVGISAGTGGQLHYKHLGFMSELRYSGIITGGENPLFGRFRYHWFSFLFGLTFQF